MSGRAHRRSLVRIAFAVFVATALFAGRLALPGTDVSALSRWTGGIDLYRNGVFTTQKTWLWCTAADVQIIKNIVDGQTDHSRTNQSRYFTYMRAHDRYAIPVSDGTDPGGWTAGLRHYVDSRYRLYQSTSFGSALRSAVTNMRKTNMPVALAVDHGNHGWVMTGFTATADPARTTSFTVTSVRVVGPLWGLQSRTYGYDMRPDTKLTPRQLQGFFTPWHYGRVRMAWEGKWVSIQPVATTTTAAVPLAAVGVQAPVATGVLPPAAVAAQAPVAPEAAPPAAIADARAGTASTEATPAPATQPVAPKAHAKPVGPTVLAATPAAAPVQEALPSPASTPVPAIAPLGLAGLIVVVALGVLARRHRPPRTAGAR